jgi:hypothetical protein
MNTEQPTADSTVSIEDRAAAALFGAPSRKPQAPEPIPEAPEPQAEAPNDEQTPEAASDADSVAPQTAETFEFELEGEKFALPKKLEKALMHERDYTQKSQELAQQRKQVEYIQQQARIANFRAEFEREAADDLQKLTAYDSVLSEPLKLDGLSEGEATKTFLQRAQWKEEREVIAARLREKHQQWSQKTDNALKELQSKADEAVRQRVPNWNADTWKTVSDHAKNDGYSDVELGSINDPRHKLTLWKAQQFDALKAKASKTVVEAKTVKTTPTNPMPQHVKEQLNFRKQLAKTAPNSFERNKAVEDRVANMRRTRFRSVLLMKVALGSALPAE